VAGFYVSLLLGTGIPLFLGRSSKRFNFEAIPWNDAPFLERLLHYRRGILHQAVKRSSCKVARRNFGNTGKVRGSVESRPFAMEPCCA